MAFDPATGQTEHFGIAKAKHGIISVTPDESRGLIYVSTCSDDRPIEHSHFMVYDRNDKKYTDFGDMEHPYAYITIDNKGQADHPIPAVAVARNAADPKPLE